MGIYKAHCLVKIEDGEKSYVTPELKYFTTDPRKAYFYDSIEEAESDLEYHLNRDEYAYEYMIAHNPNYAKPEYKIEEVEIKVWEV